MHGRVDDHRDTGFGQPITDQIALGSHREHRFQPEFVRDPQRCQQVVSAMAAEDAGNLPVEQQPEGFEFQVTIRRHCVVVPGSLLLGPIGACPGKGLADHSGCAHSRGRSLARIGLLGADTQVEGHGLGEADRHRFGVDAVSAEDTGQPSDDVGPSR